MAPDKGPERKAITSSVADRLEPKGKGRTCKLRVKVWMIKEIELQVNGEGSDVAAWRWRHMKINGHC